MKKRIAIYVMTYNTPFQFELWCESLRLSASTFFEMSPKFVIDNSDDIELNSMYLKLFEKYNFQIIHKGVNYGINGGRYLAAEHFNNSLFDYMIFFEDDMTLREPILSFCKSGFKTYHPSLFEDIIDIVEKENLHYLKLCFSEVFGSNNENWAIKSLTKEDNCEIRKSDPDGFFVSEYTYIQHINITNGLAYAVGSFFYCNWPILFTKSANKLLFIDYPNESKCEISWTRLAYLLSLKGLLKTGCLLASPIKHSRKYLYDPKRRFENELGLQFPDVTICIDTN